GVRRGGRPTDRHNLVITMIERRTNEVVHPSIDNRKLLRTRFFNETHACEQHTGVANKKTTRLHQNAKMELAQFWHNRIRILADAERKRFATVIAPPFA